MYRYPVPAANNTILNSADSTDSPAKSTVISIIRTNILLHESGRVAKSTRPACQSLITQYVKKGKLHRFNFLRKEL